MIPERVRFLVSFLLLEALILVDQLSKGIATAFFPERVVCNAIGPWGFPIPASILSVLTFGILILLIGVQWKRRVFDTAFLLIVAGGIGNWLDRVLIGCVTDFLELPFFPVFNLADASLSVGCFLWGVAWWQERRLRAEN